ncbi:cyclin-D3-3 [Gossypium australe]|uniref:Cyclin-D3-3 n=1 Tax=Gossypium australe TaxID=47621 RepID=A0A5B6VYI1_9ROSI|nr:cyclin-D3-3 [Gossypium australe]
MAIQQHEQEETYPSFLLDGLYCEEDDKNGVGEVDLFWEEEARREAVEWMLKVNAHYGFTPLTTMLFVEGTKYVFEAKTIQRMELLVLLTLKWKMHPITPLSFLDHIIRRLGLKTHLHREFLKRCEHLFLFVISDSRSVQDLPSVLATETMMHVIDQVEVFNPVDYQNQLLTSKCS